MTTLDPAAQDAAVQAQLAAQAAAVTGNPAAAGVYGDPAGASAAPQAIDLSQAKATVVDAENLLARLQELEAKAAAQEAAANPPPPAPDYSLRADPSAPGWMHDLFNRTEQRLAAVEDKLGI